MLQPTGRGAKIARPARLCAPQNPRRGLWRIVELAVRPTGRSLALAEAERGPRTEGSPGKETRLASELLSERQRRVASKSAEPRHTIGLPVCRSASPTGP